MNQTIYKPTEKKTNTSPDQPNATQAVTSELKYAVIDFEEKKNRTMIDFERDKPLKQ